MFNLLNKGIKNEKCTV